MTRSYHPQVKRLLDGELEVSDLAVELRAEGEAALRLLAAVDRSAVALSPALDARVMAAVRRRAASRSGRVWRWLTDVREIRVRVRPWLAIPALAAGFALLLGRPVDHGADSVARGAAGSDSVFVRFVLYAPEAHRVALAGTFNEWDPAVTPLVPGAEAGVWITTVALAPGQHQYAFVIDGERWVADPAAPRVDDGFGRMNSVLAVASGGRTL
jgi:hypothetical protein